MSPAGTEPAGAVRHRRSPEGVSFREKANQSNLRFELPSSWPTLWSFELCPRRESNPHLRFRKPPFYPLNYEDGNQRSAVRCQRSESESSRFYVSNSSFAKRCFAFDGRHPLKTRADYCANAIVVQLCDWRKDVAAPSRHDKSRGRRGARQAKSRSKHMKSIVTQISFRVAGLAIVPITTSCSRTTAREDHSERPQLTKLQFAVTNRRSGRYGNTSRIWPSRSFRCTLRQKSG